MANQGRVFAAALSLSMMVGPGLAAPAAGEPLSPPPSDVMDGFAPDGAFPPPAAIPACELPWGSLGEHYVTTEGSGPSLTSTRPDSTSPERSASSELSAASGVEDGWAQAYADGSRVPRAAVLVPAYPVEVNSQVQFFLDLFTGSRRDVVTLWVNRSGRYLGMARETFRERGMPEELAFTAMIESGFKPDAVSRVGAKGMWQFMAGTARRYGLRVDRWVDERLDPEKSTVAAARYLRDLHDMFGSWALAQAAYNAGEVKVARAIRLTGSRDFWTLAESRYLRRETKDFVPQIHAATMIGREPDRYGFDFDHRDPVPVDTITVPPSTDLRRLSEKAGLSVAAVRSLNPTLVRGVTPPGRSWTLRIPEGERERVVAALAPSRVTTVAGGRPDITRVAANGDVHVVRPRDTVSGIAHRYGISVNDLMRWNRLDPQDRIRPGDRLRVARSTER
jgi:membrane-bound lytic murein transglycosylase D